MLQRWCCCFPMTDPGRMMRSQPMACRAPKPHNRIRYNEMSAPVHPSPYLQCTATAPSRSTTTASAAARKAATTQAAGQESAFSRWRMQA